MYTIYATKYHNDYTKQTATMQFHSLDDIFKYLKKISNDFNNKYGNYFPTRNNRANYEWCGRIACRNEYDSIYRDFWVHMIKNDNGIIYSDGKMTKGEKFCAALIEDWLEHCREAANKKPNFVEC